MEKSKGRPPIEVTKTDLVTIEKLARYGSTLDEIALCLGWSPATLDRKLKLPDVEAAYKRGRLIASHSMAERLWDIAMSNDEKGVPTKQSVIAAIFWLKAQAGWTDRVSISTDTNEPVNPIQIYLPDNGR